MRRVAIILAGLSMACPASSGYAASLRSTSMISAGTVRLSDIFSDLEPGQDRVLGPGPAPGSSIQVSGQQLIAIADQYGVDWDDQSPSASMTISRAGRILDESYFATLIRKDLPDIGDGPESISLHDFHPVTVSADEAEPVILSDVRWDQRSGWFSATVYRAHPSGDLTADSFMLTGFVHAAQRVMVYARSLAAGSVISAADVKLDEAYSGRLPSRAVTDPVEADGQTLSRGVVAGSAVIAQDLQRTLVMHKGDPVMITYVAPGLKLSIAGRVLEDAGARQQVRALNEASGMVVSGRVTDGSNVEVALTSHPVPSDPNMLRRLSAAMRNPAP